MSLAEQTDRVAGGGKNALKKILQKLGVTVGDVPIDQYADLADQISDKLLPDNLCSADTFGLYGLPGTSVLDDVLKKIGEFLPALNGHVQMEKGTYIGTDTEEDHLTDPKTISFSGDPTIVFVTSLSPTPHSASGGAYLIAVNNCPYSITVSTSAYDDNINLGPCTWGERSFTITEDSPGMSFNHAGRKYAYIAFYAGEDF